MSGGWTSNGSPSRCVVSCNRYCDKIHCTHTHTRTHTRAHTHTTHTHAYTHTHTHTCITHTHTRTHACITYTHNVYSNSSTAYIYIRGEFYNEASNMQAAIKEVHCTLLTIVLNNSINCITLYIAIVPHFYLMLLWLLVYGAK